LSRQSRAKSICVCVKRFSWQKAGAAPHIAPSVRILYHPAVRSTADIAMTGGAIRPGCPARGPGMTEGIDISIIIIASWRDFISRSLERKNERRAALMPESHCFPQADFAVNFPLTPPGAGRAPARKPFRAGINPRPAQKVLRCECALPYLMTPASANLPFLIFISTMTPGTSPAASNSWEPAAPS